MSKLKLPIIPLSASSPKLPISKNLIPSSNPISSYGKSQKADLLFGNETDSDATGSKSDSGKSQTQSPVFETSYVDPRLALFDKNVEAMRSNLKDGKATVGTKAQSSSIFLKPTDQKRIKDLLLFADGGKEGASSGDYRYNPKTDKIESLAKPESTTSTTQAEYSEETDIMASMSDDFSFDGWDSKSAKQQQQELQRAGLSPQDQLTLLNSSTSLETLALIADISKSRGEYGLSAQDVKDISTELLQISNARTGAKNHDIPFFVSATTRDTFLTLLNEKEQALLSSFGYGVKGLRDKNNPYADIGDQVSDLLSGDDSIPAILHGDSDVIQAADEFFDGMGKLGTLIDDIEDGKVSFDTASEKQRYLDYLTSAYEKNESLYRQKLASKIDDAKLLQFPKTRFKELINDLSLSQLEGFVEQIDENGIKMLSRPRNFEKLMKDLLSDKDSALDLVADDTKSPIRPYVFNGIDIVKEVGIQISGYYFEDGGYKGKITCPNQKQVSFEIGNKLPEEVAISVSYADQWDIQSDIALREATSLPGVVEGIFQVATGIFGVPRFLPEPIGPTDVPYVGEALEQADWSNDDQTLKEGSIIVSIFVHFPNDHITDYHYVEFYTD